MNKLIKYKGHLYVRARGDYYDFDTDNPLSIEDVAKKWAVDGDKPDYWGSFTVDYPLSEVWQYREYDRSPSFNRSNLTKEEWASLRSSLEEKGWDREEPAMMLFGKNGVAKLGEGNHRLWLAKELGMKTVPVRFAGFWQSVEPGVGRGSVI